MNVARLVGRFRGRRGNSEVGGDSLHIQFLEGREELADSLSGIPSENLDGQFEQIMRRSSLILQVKRAPEKC